MTFDREGNEAWGGQCAILKLQLGSAYIPERPTMSIE